MSLIDDYKLAGALFGGKTIQPTGTGYLASDTYTLYGVAQSDSSNGQVSVLLDNYDPDDPENTTCSTAVSVKSGDRVLVSVTGFSFSVTSVIGGGDRMQGEIDGASDAANNAASDAAIALSNASFAQTQAAGLAADALAASQAASTAQTQASNAATAAAQAATDLAITAEELADEVDARIKWLNWTDTSLRIGQTGSPFSTEYTNTYLAFLQGNIELARFAGNKMHNPVIEVGSKLSIGNSAVGTFDWIYEDAGDLVFKYSGGA